MELTEAIMLEINRLTFSNPEIFNDLSDINKQDKMRDHHSSCGYCGQKSQQSNISYQSGNQSKEPIHHRTFAFHFLLPLTLWILASCHLQSVGALPEVIKLGKLKKN